MLCPAHDPPGRYPPQAARKTPREWRTGGNTWPRSSYPTLPPVKPSHTSLELDDISRCWRGIDEGIHGNHIVLQENDMRYTYQRQLALLYLKTAA